MARLNVHLSWALFTFITCAVWGRWTGQREEPELLKREWTQAAAARERARIQVTPLSDKSESRAPAGRATSPADSSEDPTSLSEEDLVKAEILRLLHSPHFSEQWEGARMIKRILLPRLQGEMYHEALASKNESLRQAALNGIVRLEGAEARTVVEKVLLKDPSEDLREAAAAALGSLESPQAIDALLEAYHDPALNVRVAAAAALLRLGQPGPVLELIPLFSKDLESPDAAVRREAAESLGNLNSPLAIPPLCRALRDSNGNVRSSAADGLGSMTVPEIIPALKSLLQDPDKEVADLARRTLEDYEAQHPQ